MKIEIEKREYDRLKSREEKLLAYYEWWKEWEWMDLNTIEEVINDNIRLREENKKMKEENVRLVKNLAEYKNEITDLKEENKKLKAEFEQYKQNYNIEKDKQQIFLMTWKRY